MRAINLYVAVDWQGDREIERGEGGDSLLSGEEEKGKNGLSLGARKEKEKEETRIVKRERERERWAWKTEAEIEKMERWKGGGE